MTIKDISDLAGCRAVVAVQEQVWGAGSEIVPASVLFVSAKRGGILIGAYEGAHLAGFVWSMPGVRDGVRTHWSHMLGVVPSARGQGVGERLKLAQRERALGQDVELIEWTFDPLQAPNAHLNFAILGCVATTYLEDVYGDMAGPLHRGTATDRLIAEWRIREPHVERRLAARGSRSMTARGAEILAAPRVIRTDVTGDWIAPLTVDLTADAPRILVPVPPRFTEMQESALERARAWRAATRDVFTTYFGRGYQAVDFQLDLARGGGEYLLSRVP